MDPANKTTQPVSAGLGQDSANTPILSPPATPSTGETMHTAADVRDAGQAQAMAATSAEDCSCITTALCEGWEKLGIATAEEALAATGFQWPPTAPPRALGAIVRHLASAGYVVSGQWELGRSPRSHRGRVTRWRWIGGAT